MALPTPRIATTREISENGYRAVIERLAGTADPTLAPLLARLIAAHETLAVLRTQADAATHRPKSERNPSRARLSESRSGLSGRHSWADWLAGGIAQAGRSGRRSIAAGQA